MTGQSQGVRSEYNYIAQCDCDHYQACGCVCWSPSFSEGSARVAAGYSDGTLRIFQLTSSEMEMKLHPHHVAVTAIQYSANGERQQQCQGDA